MNSKKVKEIKKALEEAIEWCARELEKDLFQKSLTLINELESENERLKHLREVDYKTMTTLRQANTELNECMDEMQDRIAELEKEIKENVFYAKGYAEGIKNTYEVVMPNKLKQFAKRLKEKCEFNRKEYCCEATVSAKDIDETLNEFLKG